MTQHLRVNPIACDAHGMCGELLPELISIDEWGYPRCADGPIPEPLQELARRAAQACPAMALLIEARQGERNRS